MQEVRREDINWRVMLDLLSKEDRIASTVRKQRKILNKYMLVQVNDYNNLVNVHNNLH